MTAEGAVPMEITEADERHIPAIQQIYAYHVLHGTATFETEPPDPAEMTARLKKVRAAGLPWFVAVEDGNVRGYCYLSLYRERFATDSPWRILYILPPTFRAQGIGKKLLLSAVTWAEDRSFRQLVAVVGNSENSASLAPAIARQASALQERSDLWASSTDAGLIRSSCSVRSGRATPHFRRARVD